jgi:hypothetical protein
VPYKRQIVGEARLDLLVQECLVVELEAAETIAPIHVAQLISYLKATRLTRGLLITFKVTALPRGIKRVIQTARGLAHLREKSRLCPTPPRHCDRSNAVQVLGCSGMQGGAFGGGH